MNKQEIVKALVKSKIASVDEIKGCSEAEVIKLEKSIGSCLPKKYREFLLGAGYKAGKLFQGTDIFFNNLKDIKETAIDLLIENDEAFSLPEDSFVFSMHQGYEFKFFLLSEGDDPPIYQYVEGDGDPKLTWEKFSSFLAEEITVTAKIINKM